MIESSARVTVGQEHAATGWNVYNPDTGMNEQPVGFSSLDGTESTGDLLLTEVSHGPP